MKYHSVYVRNIHMGGRGGEIALSLCQKHTYGGERGGGGGEISLSLCQKHTYGGEGVKYHSVYVRNIHMGGRGGEIALSLCQKHTYGGERG